VQRRACSQELVCTCAHGSEIAEIKREELERAVAGLGSYLVNHRQRLWFGPACDEHASAPAGQRERRLPPDPGVGAGYEKRSVVEIADRWSIRAAS
jgi:hypothetical protein